MPSLVCRDVSAKNIKTRNRLPAQNGGLLFLTGARVTDGREGTDCERKTASPRVQRGVRHSSVDARVLLARALVADREPHVLKGEKDLCAMVFFSRSSPRLADNGVNSLRRGYDGEDGRRGRGGACAGSNIGGGVDAHCMVWWW